MAGRINELFEKMEDRDDLHFYDELAPIYDFVYGKMINYEDQASRVKTYSPAGSQTLIEIACGNGRAIEKLKKDYEKVVGLDLGRGNVEIARERNPEVDILREDMTELEIDEKFDTVAVLGYSLGSLTPEELAETMENLSNIVSPGGRIILDHIGQNASDGEYTEQFYEHPDNFKVGIRTITSLKDDKHEKFAMSYHIVDLDSDKERKAAEIHAWYHHSTQRVVELLEENGLQVKVEGNSGEVFETQGLTIIGKN